MEDDTEYVGALEVIAQNHRAQANADSDREEKLQESRFQVDEARLALSQLAKPAVAVIAMRLMGVDVDENGKPVTVDRESTALAVLDRIGIPKLRATAIAASMVSSTQMPAVGAPGWVPLENSEDDAIGVGEVDAHIDAFLAGARAAKDLAGE